MNKKWKKLKHYQNLLFSLNLKLSLNNEFSIGKGLFLLFNRRFSFFFYGFRVVNGGLYHPCPPALSAAGA